MQPLRFLAFAAVLLPLAEIYAALQVASAVGVVATLALLVLAGVLGSLLVRRQGVGVLLRLRQAIERGETPAAEVAEGALVAVAGLLLVLPGLLTDVLALLLLVPPVRRQLASRWLKAAPLRVGAAPPGQRVIEGEWRRER